MTIKKRKWKRRLVLATLFLMVLTGMFAYLVVSRFHFSTQTLGPLAKLQWDHQTTIELKGKHPLIIGHRGAGISSSVGDLTIGNTRTAIAKGIRDGVDWIEIDIRASSDDRLVVFHDETLDKKTNGTGNVASTSLAELLTVEVNVEPPEYIPSLEDLFEEFRSENTKWILDIKAEGIQELVLKWLDGKIALGELSRDQFIIFGVYDVLSDYKDAGYSIGYTAIWGNFANRLRVLFRQSQIISRCRSLDCDYLVLPAIFANRSLIESARAEGFEVWTYGVVDEREFKYLANSGVSGFIVDQPHKFTSKGKGSDAGTNSNTLDRTR